MQVKEGVRYFLLLLLLMLVVEGGRGRVVEIREATSKNRMIELASFGFSLGGKIQVSLNRSLLPPFPPNGSSLFFDKLLVLNSKQHEKSYSIFNPQSSCYSPSIFVRVALSSSFTILICFFFNQRKEFNQQVSFTLNFSYTDKYFLILVNCNEQTILYSVTLSSLLFAHF